MSQSKGNPRSYFYVTEAGLRNLKDYKYIGNDRSIIAKQLQPWWNYAVTFVPMDIAPNLVTLIGFVFIIFSFFLQIYYSPNVEGEAPRFVYLLNAFCVFVYQTLDAIDGKQARRTGTSSPLGELFDHGCDSMTATFMLLTVGAALQVGSGWFLYFMMLTDLVAFYLAQWEEYHSGILDLGIVNVTEAQYAVMAIHVATAILGPNFWNTSITIAGFSIPLKYIVAGGTLPGLYFNIYENIIRVMKLIKEKNLNSTQVWSGLVPVVCAILLGTSWAYYSPSQVIFTHSIAFLVGIGFLFSTLVGKIVLARVCKMPFDAFQGTIIPIAIGLINALFQGRLFPEVPYVYAWALFSVASFLHLALEVIEAFCKHLDIYCLSIKHKRN